MRRSFALVKKLKSNCDDLIFKDFQLSKIKHIGDRALKETKRLFPNAYVFKGDWIYKREYKNSVNNEIMLLDIENTLLLLRLYKTGDIFFIQPCFEDTDGNLSQPLPYPVMVYTATANKYEIDTEECSTFDIFSSKTISQSNWSSSWFAIARRFFLYGGGKEYNPSNKYLDRIVDYMTVLESILVPESDFVGRRLRERAVKLIKSTETEVSAIKLYLRDLYNIRSIIVHGSEIGSKNMSVLNNINQFEYIVRATIVNALTTFPNGDDNRKKFLKQLFDICDETRAENTFNSFCKIKGEPEKKSCIEQILSRIS